MSYFTQTPADPAASADALRHRHSLSYMDSSVSGFYTPETGQYGATRGTCRDCGLRILQVCAEGDTLASNRRAFIAVAELEEAYAMNEAHTEAAYAAETAATALERPAQEGRVVQERHVEVCERRGHADHYVAGRLQPVCPRCGEFTETAPAELSTSELVRAYAAARVLDATVEGGVSRWEHRRHIAVVTELRARGVLDDR